MSIPPTPTTCTVGRILCCYIVMGRISVSWSPRERAKNGATGESCYPVRAHNYSYMMSFVVQGITVERSPGLRGMFPSLHDFFKQS